MKLCACSVACARHKRSAAAPASRWQQSHLRVAFNHIPCSQLPEGLRRAQVSIQTRPWNIYLVACLLVCYKIYWLGGVLGEEHPLTVPRLLSAPALPLQRSRKHIPNCTDELLAAHIELLQGAVYPQNICNLKVIEPQSKSSACIQPPHSCPRGGISTVSILQKERKGREQRKAGFTERYTGAQRPIEVTLRFSTTHKQVRHSLWVKIPKLQVRCSVLGSWRRFWKARYQIYYPVVSWQFMQCLVPGSYCNP